jgi:hypothetical protein
MAWDARMFSVQRQGLAVWIIVAVAACAGLGAWLGRHVGSGNFGNIALIGATCAVLGSFLPGVVLWIRARLRGRGRPHRADM